MIRQIKGQISAGKGRFGIVVSRFNEFISSRLLEGAIDCLQRHGAADEQITVIWVPGACEIPPVARRLAQGGNLDAVICLGAVIRGDTGHYEAVFEQVVRGIGQINLECKTPAVFGVITCDNLQQAIERAGTKLGNAGASAAMTAMELVNVIAQIP